MDKKLVSEKNETLFPPTQIVHSRGKPLYTGRVITVEEMTEATQKEAVSNYLTGMTFIEELANNPKQVDKSLQFLTRNAANKR